MASPAPKGLAGGPGPHRCCLQRPLGPIRIAGRGWHRGIDAHPCRGPKLQRPQVHIGIDVSGLEGLVDPAVGYRFAAGTLGAAAIACFMTFTLAPRFKESLKEPLDWREDMYPKLISRKTSSVSPAEANKLVKEGAVLLDVDLASAHEVRAALGSSSAPMYQPIAGWDIPSIARRAGFAFFGVAGTERNVTWLDDIKATVPIDRQVVVICNMGGSLEPKNGVPCGFQSRSLKAIYYLQEAGYKNVAHVQGGLGQWERDGLPVAGG